VRRCTAACPLFTQELLMEAERTVGRALGVLLLAHLAAGLMVPYILLRPVVMPPGFLTNAAGSAAQIRAAVLLMFVGSAVAVGIAIAALPVFRRYSQAMALWLAVLAAVNFALQAVDSGAVLSMLSMSQEYAVAGAADAALYQAAGAAVGSIRRWAHYTHLLVLGSWIFVLHGLLYRFELVPRVLAGIGLVATVSQITGVTLRVILGYPGVGPMAMPLGVTYLALALWLMVKGFSQPRRSLGREAPAA
jgi:hypothetical protein